MSEVNHSPNGVLMEPLTWREQDILSLLAERQTNREIAQALGLELTTVKWYNQQLFSKLHVSSRYQAVEKAEAYGLLDEAPRERAAESGSQKGRLPIQPSSFVGREREISEIKALLRQAHLLTLTGPAGTGKTRLALQVAHDLADGGAYADGVFFIDLALLKQPELVADTVAEALGILDVSGQSVVETLKHNLANKNALLLIDNFEHVVEAAPLVSDLLSAAPELFVLATSREVLNLYGEQEYLVSPLALPVKGPDESPAALTAYESVMLFVQRARAARPGFDLTEDNARTVADICVRLDGLPLAIELAAARIRLYAPRTLLQALENRLTVLRGGQRDLPERLQTLRGALDWSYELLNDAEKHLFARLAVFQGGRTIEAVEVVCSQDLPLDVLDGLDSLLSKNLLRHEDGPEGEPRFVMLETIREYGREKLEASGEAEEMRRRHAEYFTTFAERLYPDTRGGSRQMWALRRMDADYENLRAALRWSLDGGNVGLGMRLVGSLSFLWWRWLHPADGQRWTARAVEAADSNVNPRARAGALMARALLAPYRNEYEVARQCAQEAEAIFRELGDKLGLAWALLERGLLSIGLPDEYEEAVALCEESMQLQWAADHPSEAAFALNVLGELARANGDYAAARRAYEETLAIARDIGDILREAKQYINLGFVAEHEGDPNGARAYFKKYIELGLEMDHKPFLSYGVIAMAGPAVAEGDLERAARLIGAGTTHFNELGGTPHAADAPEFERTLDDLRAQLDEATFQAAWTEGQAMSLEEAVAYALAEPGPDQ